MKIDYDVSLYKKIARLGLNVIVQVKNRKGVRHTIHIQNITKLSWHELQLLVPYGDDKFTKMVLLYEQYTKNNNSDEPIMAGETLTPDESDELNDYIRMYRENSFSKHFEVNEYISANNLWDRFPTIRSLNDHGDYKGIKGIQPKYFEIICRLLDISGEEGAPLDAYTKY
ncbi:MAG: hypothetical protein M8364_06825 [Methylobacter sp.]|uniref:hypothetical protein n=1 Tax=Methylobacter sp. TaxID=2051955 RepID=UPI0025876C96|nr:hypothetical protein [Methylobacter sp.]MCL7420600.1 hypothetical protein [Methylobacter sp.]